MWTTGLTPMYANAADLPAMIQGCLDAALATDLPAIKKGQPTGGSFPMDEPERRPSPNNVSVFCWPQLWSDTSCGFGGLAGQAFTTAYTVCIQALYGTEPVAVYIAGRLAYTILDPSPAFWAAVDQRSMVGAYQDCRGYCNSSRKRNR